MQTTNDRVRLVWTASLSGGVMHAMIDQCDAQRRRWWVGGWFGRNRQAMCGITIRPATVVCEDRPPCADCARRANALDATRGVEHDLDTVLAPAFGVPHQHVRGCWWERLWLWVFTGRIRQHPDPDQ